MTYVNLLRCGTKGWRDKKVSLISSFIFFILIPHLMEGYPSGSVSAGTVATLGPTSTFALNQMQINLLP